MGGSPGSPSQEPKATSEIDDITILKFLIRESLRPSSADMLTNTISRIRLLADYYYNNCKWEDIREHETRTFLVIPLLLALGWAEQQLKIELPCSKGRIDIACFSKAYVRKNDECAVLIETKDFSSGLDYAQNQAKKYSHNFPTCKVVVVTNGYCYKTYLRDKSGNFSTQPSAYLNLLKPRSAYPLDPDNVSGALDAIKWLLRVSPLSGQETGSFKVHSVPALNDFIVSTILSKKRSSESLYIQRSGSLPYCVGKRF